VLAGFAPNLNKRLHVGHLKNLAKGGPAGFQFAVAKAFQGLEHGLLTLGLFPLHEV
jgi:hypothetical protein